MPVSPLLLRRAAQTAAALLWLPVGVLLASVIHGTFPSDLVGTLLSPLFLLLLPAGLPLALAALFVHRWGYRTGLELLLLPVAALTSWQMIYAGLLGWLGIAGVALLLSLPIWLIPVFAWIGRAGRRFIPLEGTPRRLHAAKIAALLLWLPLGVLLISAMRGTFPTDSIHFFLLSNLFFCLAGLPLGLAVLFVHRRGFRTGLHLLLVPLALLTSWLVIFAGLLGPIGIAAVALILSLPMWLIPVFAWLERAGRRLGARKAPPQ